MQVAFEAISTQVELQVIILADMDGFVGRDLT